MTHCIKGLEVDLINYCEAKLGECFRALEVTCINENARKI